MVTFFCNKLGRDKIIEICQQNNVEVDCYVMDDQAYQRALVQKLEEEAQEVIAAAPGELLEEIADVQEIIDCLLKTHGFSKEQLQIVQEEKRKKRGSFVEKIYINSFTVDDDSPWKSKFMSEPHKYSIKK